MGKGPGRRGHQKKSEEARRHAVTTGHRPHITGAGAHDTRPRGQRDRSGTRRAALADQLG